MTFARLHRWFLLQHARALGLTPQLDWHGADGRMRVLLLAATAQDAMDGAQTLIALHARRVFWLGRVDHRTYDDQSAHVLAPEPKGFQ